MSEQSVGSIPVRIFRDETDREWEVRAIREPLVEHRSPLLTPPELENGWLLFTSCGERRRLAPLPPGWVIATETQLNRWCVDAADAERVPMRRSGDIAQQA